MTPGDTWLLAFVLMSLWVMLSAWRQGRSTLFWFFMGAALSPLGALLLLALLGPVQSTEDEEPNPPNDEN